MNLSRWTQVVIGLLLAFVAVIPAMGAPILGAGGREHAWIALESSWRQDKRWTLYHAPASVEEGGALRVRTLPGRPDALAAWGDVLTLFYAPTSGAESGERIRQVRSITATGLLEGARFRYDPPTRERVLPALPGWGQLIGVNANDTGVFALLRERDRLELLRLGPTEWATLQLPADVSAGSIWRLAPSETGVSLLETLDGQGRHWRSDGLDGDWSVESAPSPLGESLVFAAQQLISLTRGDEGVLRARVIKGGQAHDMPGAIQGVPEDVAIARLGDSVLAAWLDPEDDTRLQVGVLSAITGQVLYEGPALMQPVLTPRDLQYLALLLTAVLLMVLIFVLRPETGPGMEVELPSTLSPASEARRFAAALIDFLPLAVASATFWSVPFVSAIGIQIDVDGAGIWPLLTTLGACALLQSVCEWLLGWTPGKWLCACRTVTRTGGRLNIRQALVRNVVKFSCPPLLALILADPSRRHPGDYFAGTVVVMRTPPTSEEGPESGPPEA